MFKNKKEQNINTKIQIFKGRLRSQYEKSGFPFGGVELHRDTFIEKYDKISKPINVILNKIRNKQNINVMLFGKDMQKKYDIACYLFNVYFSYNCRKRCIDYNNYDHLKEARWIEARGWLSNFNRDPLLEDARHIKFVVFFDFFPCPQNLEHIRMFQSILTFRAFNKVNTIFDAGSNFKQLFNVNQKVFDDSYSGTILKQYDKIEVDKC